MYEEFYGFQQKPFTILPNPGFLYWGRTHRLAYSMLEYGLINEAPFTVISGEVGCGKTTLVNQLLKVLGNRVNIGLINSMPKIIPPGELIHWVLVAFGQQPQAMTAPALYQQLAAYLKDCRKSSRRCLLIIDEAHNLGAESLEELRMLSNMNTDSAVMLQVLIVGQPELRTLLERSDLAQFKQRVSAHYHLEPLTREETMEYIHHRTRLAGVDKQIFSSGACQYVFAASRGIPRVVNVLCDTALVYGFAIESPTIDVDLMKEVVKDHGLMEAASDLALAGRKAEPSSNQARLKRQAESPS